MVVISDIIVQGVQMLLVLLLAPLLTGYVRKIKARLVRRQGASVFQPYRDLLRLLRKEVVLADNASWLFRVSRCWEARASSSRSQGWTSAPVSAASAPAVR
jgi:formate hydrogenlyase subunit 4